MPLRSLVPERWGSPTNFRRPCEGTIYYHPATERTPEIPYDSFGYCDPTMQPAGATTVIVQQATNWMTYIVIGGAIYLAWRYRAKLKKLF